MNSVVILAGGLGTRLRSVLPNTPKCLAPVGDKSFLEILVQSLIDREFDDIVLSLGHMAESVTAAVQNFGNLRPYVRWVVEPHPLGTGGAIMNAMQQMKLQEAVVVNGDTFFGGDLSDMLVPLRQNELCRMAIVEVSDRSRYGGIDIRDSKNGLVHGFFEKGVSGPGWINAGYYRLHVNCFDGFIGEEFFSFEQGILPTLVSRQQVSYTKLRGDMIDIGIPADYEYFCSAWEAGSLPKSRL